MKFMNLSLSQPILKAVEDAGYKVPSPIQEKAIPPVLAGKDLLGCAQTGTGKTAAFALPILQRLAQPQPTGKKRPIRALVLTPTRELALQIEESFKAYGKYLPLRCTVIFGGVGQAPQVQALKQGVDILVATPGRLLDLMQQGHVVLSALEIFVLDEADRMLDMGFVQDVKKVIKVIPKKRQTLLFSATMPKEISDLADKLLHSPIKVAVTPVSSTVERIEQRLYKVDKGNKKHLLAHLLQKENAKSALVFTRTKHGADRVVRELGRAGVQAKAIHGNKSQNARQDALARLKDGRVRVLVATDIAARGLDISELSHVFNYDLPNIPETYVHRIGRTGRAGRGGVAVSFCMEEELPYLADIEKLIGFRVPEVTGHAWPLKGEASLAEKVSEKVTHKMQEKQPGREKAKTPPQPPKKREGRQQESKAQENSKEPKKLESRAAQREQKQGGPKSRTQAEGMRRGEPRAKPEAKTGGGRGGLPRQAGAQPEQYAGQTIVTRPPVWSNLPKTPPEKGGGAGPDEGESQMSKGRRRTTRRTGKTEKNNPQNEVEAQRPPLEIPKDKNGVFQFSDEELEKDDSLRLIRASAGQGEAKYASFEDYLKDH